MSLPSLTEAVDRFAALTAPLSDVQLDLPWAWQDYDSDGVRFAFFRTLEELRALAADLTVKAGRAGATPTTAQAILAQSHAAFREMHARLLGLVPDDFETIPAEGEWPLRKVIAHLVDADVGFYGVISETLRALRAGEDPPRKVPDEAWDGIVGMPIDDFDRMLEHDVEGVLAFHHQHHARILEAFSGMTEAELESPGYFWEQSPYPLRFRLGRFESHCRQHTVQIAKTRVAIGRPPNESQRLLMLLYDALAAVENAWRTSGVMDPGPGELAAVITARAAEIQRTLSGV